MKVLKLSLAFTMTFILVNANAQNVDADLLKKHVYTLASDSLQGRGFGTYGGRMAKDYVIAQFVNAGIEPWEGTYAHPFIHQGMMLKTEGTNIIGWVEGSDSILKHEYILLGAHYDHLAYIFKHDSMVVYNGADDNASGTASIIEIGRWLVQHRSELKRSVIIVAFDGEEAGLIGSTYIVNNNVLPLQKIKVMFSLDMVGMLKKYEGIDLVGDGTITDGKQFFDEIAKAHGIDVKKQGRSVEQQTDTAPFGSKGIPSIHVFTSTVSPYHRPQDDANLIDYNGMAIIADFVADATLNLSQRPEIVPDRKFLVQAKGKVINWGAIAGVGCSMDDYSDEFYNSKDHFTASVGLYARLKISSKLSLTPEVLYHTHGSDHQYGNLRTHEITIPVNVEFTLSRQANSMLNPSFFIFGGGYYSYRFSGKVGSNSMDFEDSFRREDYGYQFGLGFDVWKFRFKLSTYKSVQSLNRTQNIYPMGSLFSIGVLF
ncbi:MAG: M28 family peptidase [Bacteroidales bacterium]|nr:M28 family peptidase [Bacteroidales bacterium]HPD95545.1 M28 family peptidase [Tenuifilaceae bacterium]HRX32129.1 M28 family peptidase [Tenuifilaceae bacterium]